MLRYVIDATLARQNNFWVTRLLDPKTVGKNVILVAQIYCFVHLGHGFVHRMHFQFAQNRIWGLTTEILKRGAPGKNNTHLYRRIVGMYPERSQNRQDSPEFCQGCARLTTRLQRALVDGRNLATVARLRGAHDNAAHYYLRPVVFRERSPPSHNNATPDEEFVFRPSIPATRGQTRRQRINQSSAIDGVAARVGKRH